MRRVLVKVHLWLALALGIYIVVISVSGSAVVFRPQISRWAIPRFVPSAEGERLEGDELAAALARTYPDREVVRFNEGRFPRQPVSVLLARDGKEEGRLFDPYALEDMGSNYPPVVAFVEWLVSLHDDLLTYPIGRKINGILGGLMFIVAVTGMILWWPGKRRWAQSLYVPLGSPRKLWHLHSAIGFWFCLLLLDWSLTSVYFAFPGPIEDFRDWLDKDVTDFYRPGDGLVNFLVDAHFGRFGGTWGRTTWVVLGLTPAVLLVTGFIVWWRTQQRNRRARAEALAAESAAPLGGEAPLTAAARARPGAS
jgi:uncharacterized iron-regulated membrane protein